MDRLEKLEIVENMAASVGEMTLKGVKSKKEESKINVVYVSQMKTPSFVLEQVATRATHATHAEEGARSYKFLKYAVKTGEVEIIDEIEIGNITYKPRNSELVDKNSIFLPTGLEEYGNTTQLVDDISNYLNKYFEVDSSMEKILPNYVLFTWVFEKFPFVPYLQFMGRTSTGKTTAGETVASVCYKAIDATGATSQSAIFRVADEWGGVLFLDEFDSDVKDKEMISFLKSGVSDRAVLRVEAVGKKFTVVPYKVKAPKIFTSERVMTDAGLQSRTIIIKMEINKRKVPLFKLDDYYLQGQALRNKLLKWRLDNLENIDLSQIEYGYEEFGAFDRRVQQILTPIYHLSDKRGKRRILEFAKEQEERTKEERRNKEEGIIFSLIYEYYEREKQQPALKFITDELNKQREDLGYKTKRSERKVATIIREILDIDIKRIGHNNISTIVIEDNLDKYNELVQYYGPPSASVVSVASVADEAEMPF